MPVIRHIDSKRGTYTDGAIMCGNASHVELNMRLKYVRHKSRLPARKIIKPNVTNTKVSIILAVSAGDGSSLSSAAMSLYLRFLPDKMSGRKSNA